MKCKCPNCYATGSLEMFSNDEASQAFASVLNLTGELAKPLIRYLGLFRSENRDLSFSRTAKLINEIAPDIVAGKISRNRQSYPAPKKAWIWAINIMLERREQGLLQLPLKSHGYLYEVISNYKTDESSNFERRIDKRQETYYQQQIKEHEQQKHQSINPNVKDLFGFIKTIRQNTEVRSLKGISTEQLPAYLLGKRQEGESLLECYDRLKALELADEQSAENQPNGDLNT